MMKQIVLVLIFILVFSVIVVDEIPAPAPIPQIESEKPTITERIADIFTPEPEVKEPVQEPVQQAESQTTQCPETFSTEKNRNTSYIILIIIQFIAIIMLIVFLIMKKPKKAVVLPQIERIDPTVEYVKKMFLIGYTVSQIKNTLLKSGRKEEEVNEVFKKL